MHISSPEKGSCSFTIALLYNIIVDLCLFKSMEDMLLTSVTAEKGLKCQ